MDLQKIKFLKTAKNFEKITEGYGGAEKLSFIKNGKKYFIKIGKFSVIDNLEEIYSNADIPHPKIVQTGKLDEETSYIIEEFVEGTPLKYLLDTYDIKFLYEFGFKLGEKFRNVRKVYSDKPMDKLSYTSLFKMVNSWLCELSNSIDEFGENLSQNQKLFLNYLEHYLINNKNLIKNDIMVFGHNDVKPNNVLINGDKFYVIDFEETRYKNPALSLLWCIARNDFKDEKNHAFANGWLDGLFNFDVPKSVVASLNYVYLINICHHCTNYIKYKQLDMLDKLINHITKNYFCDGRLCVGKSVLKVATISDFPQLKDYQITLCSGSYSPLNLVFKCEQKNKKYFLKIMKTSKSGYEHIINQYNLLKIAQIPMPQIIDHDMCKNMHYCWVLQEYINFPVIGANSTDYLVAENLGGQVAKYLLNLKGKTLKNARVYSVEQIDKEINNLISECFDGENSPYFKWTRAQITEAYKRLIKNFDGEELMLIHDDIKCSNFLFDGKKIVFVDNESVMLSYQTINFQYMFAECFVGEKSIITQNFVRGYLKQIYGQNLPQKVIGQLKLIIILKLLRDSFGIKQNIRPPHYADYMSEIFEKYVLNGEDFLWLK